MKILYDNYGSGNHTFLSFYNILNWLAILTNYRTYWQNGSIAEEAKTYLQQHFFVDPSPYDVIIGYRADDSYFSFAQDFISGTIPLSRYLWQCLYRLIRFKTVCEW